MVHAIRTLQGARESDKDLALRALRESACSSPETCAARDVCVEAYETLASSQRAAAAARAALGTDIGHAAVATQKAGEYAEAFKAHATRCLQARHELATEN